MSRTVLCSKICRGDRSNPAARIADASWIDMIESPPSVKKDSVTDTRSRPSSPATTDAKQFLGGTQRCDVLFVTVAEDRCGRCAAVEFAGRVQRHLLNSTHEVGTMYSGSFCAAKFFTASASTPAGAR